MFSCLEAKALTKFVCVCVSEKKEENILRNC